MTHSLSIRVYYEDTDMAGVVYHANFLRFLERGRSEAVRALGIDQAAMRAGGLVFVVHRVEADYLRPARYDDTLVVETRFARVRGASLHASQRVLRGGEELLRAEVGLACMSVDGGPQRIPADIRAALAAAAA
ncbi:tol-pal system-associated acyl-CoA thioesterase [Oceanicella sp. SM1341]|uniref:tol-pal system-associated acyl-CoA thioesterase n=1 Tax=Oceanicella sp. SM1341 TaxID=1548889 RepID=UPI000E4BCCE0|nr:tol-pal system-associated acyl-CoA thioesterase [Oceanicella sp. SM1341]